MLRSIVLSSRKRFTMHTVCTWCTIMYSIHFERGMLLISNNSALHFKWKSLHIGCCFWGSKPNPKPFQKCQLLRPLLRSSNGKRETCDFNQDLAQANLAAWWKFLVEVTSMSEFNARFMLLNNISLGIVDFKVYKHT